MSENELCIRVACTLDKCYTDTIVDHINKAASDPANGICKRKRELIEDKILSGESIIAFSDSGEWAGFCYLHTWENGMFVSSCGLVIADGWRSYGIAQLIKEAIVELVKNKYPDSRLFGLTTSSAVMKINSKLGYNPVTYAAVTIDPEFWQSCKTCSNFPILQSKEYKNCLCTAMLYQPNKM